VISLSWRSTAPGSTRNWPPANCLVTAAGPLRAPSATSRACSKRLMEEPYFRMKSATCRCAFRRRCCASCRRNPRERREDLPLLVRAFLADHAASTGKRIDGISDDALAVLMEYDWPGNVRELRNGLEYAVIRARSSLVQLEDLPLEVLDIIPPADQTEAEPSDTLSPTAGIGLGRGIGGGVHIAANCTRALFRRLDSISATWVSSCCPSA